MYNFNTELEVLPLVYYYNGSNNYTFDLVKLYNKYSITNEYIGVAELFNSCYDSNLLCNLNNIYFTF